jgi:hypothetical protein
MNPGTRACLAYVAGRVVSGSNRSSVYDYSRSKHISIGGSIDKNRVNIYDYERNCHFSGTLPRLYDYGISANVSLEIKGTSFSGYDYGASHAFSGSVRGSSISVYDYGVSQHFSYTV